MMKFVAIIFAAAFACTVALAQTDSATPAPSASPAKKGHAEKKSEKNSKKKETKATGDTLPKDVKKLVVQDIIPGQGKPALKGKMIKVNYTGWIYDPTQTMGRGKKFDSSVGSDPFSFKLGGGEVIKGWDQGFENMKVGGKRKLIIPPELAYGSNGAGDMIPPNSTLMFEVELLDVQ